jgi:uncharacterized protein (TIGR03067 family)
MILRPLLLVTIGLVLTADDPKDLAKKDLAKLQGTWTTASLIYNGKDLSNDGKLKLKFSIKDDKGTIEGNDQVKKEYATITFKLDPSTSPRCVDMTIDAGVQKDTVIEGIYELKDDEFKICAKVLGKERPLKFESTEGSSIVVIVLKRD